MNKNISTKLGFLIIGIFSFFMLLTLFNSFNTLKKDVKNEIEYLDAEIYRLKRIINEMDEKIKEFEQEK